MKFEPLLNAAPFSGARVKPFDGTRQYLSTGDLQDDSLSFVEVTFKDKPSRADIAVREGDVLFARMKGTKKVLRVTQELAGTIVSTGFAVLRPGEDCDPAYLATYLSTDYFERQKEKYCSGAIQPAITNGGIEKLQIPLPPIDDQVRIAHLLGKVEGLITQRKQHLQQLDDLLKSVFLEMFGEPVRNEKGWDQPELKAFGKISTGNTPPRNEPANFDGDFIEWIKTDNIAGDAVFVTPSTEHLSEVGARKARTVTSGALLVACIAGSVESIGRAALTDRTVSFNQQINAIQPGKDVNPLYLYGLFKLSRAYIQSHATKGMKKILTKGDFEKITMIKPPFEIQNQFAVIVEKVEGIKSLYQQSLTDLEALYGALSQQAFKGELDLFRIEIPQSPPAEVLPVETLPAMAAPMTTPIELPELPAELTLSGVGRLAALQYWFQAALKSVPKGGALQIEKLIDAINFRLIAMDDQDIEFSSADYEALKFWIFEALAAGTLTQAFDDAGDYIQLKAGQA
ncbi:MAG: restriction endonuclease subunit S [Burkholderiales bacterium]